MRRVLASVFALSFALTIGAASSAQAQAVRAVAQKAKSAKDRRYDPDRRVCREKVVTGSRLMKAKTCRTAREWAELNRANIESVRQFQQPGGLQEGVGPPDGG